ncbi:uncharacterized protein PV06_00721 [Exophiala oligosperma]|uniref:Uncharacterized protein n=1 Tax=Exophiala oligosperma TaxID=215243 RepID=A0A0D2CE26_9EURO|nr:uncharacterized protein PV06_00721 [Exophiala oligosperma]KIW48102.1 hypothetical protein PV06_00721 [Exophiala oligosperma]
MSKPKAFLKKSKAKKKEEQVRRSIVLDICPQIDGILNSFQALETADDFQAAGVDFEEAAGKWRAGDAAKSLRFFDRAIGVYSQGLQKFPGSLDLAYNKARVLLEIATHPILVQQLPGTPWDILQQALEAHRYALNLAQDNADTLFNTAQVLTAIAEASAKDPDRPEQEALQALEEALELQSRCLAIQELKLEESIQQQNEAAAQLDSTGDQADVVEQKGSNSDDDTDDGGASLNNNNAADQWFAVVESVTKETLIDTILAELGTLTTLCSILSSSTTSTLTTRLAWIEEFSSKLVKAKLPTLLQDADAERRQEVALAKANLVSALLETGYRSESIDASTYKRERDEAFKDPDMDLEKDFPALLANANSLVAFNVALSDIDINASSASQRWNALSAAIANLAAASKISGPVPEDIAETHMIRGNCSLLQHQLGQPPTSYKLAITNKSQLLQNADTFYRNASKLYQDEDMKAICQFRGLVAQTLIAGSDLMSTLASWGTTKSKEWVESQIQDMIDEGLLAAG